MSPDRIEKFYSAKQLAKRLSISIRTLDRWVEDRKIPAPLQPYSRPRRWLRVQLDEWLRDRRISLLCLTCGGVGDAAGVTCTDCGGGGVERCENCNKDPQSRKLRGSWLCESCFTDFYDPEVDG